MGIIDSLNDTSNKAVDVGETYYKKTQEYYRLKVFQQLTMTTGMLLKIAVIGGLAFLALIFLTVAGILFLGNKLEDVVPAVGLVSLPDDPAVADDHGLGNAVVADQRFQVIQRLFELGGIDALRFGGGGFPGLAGENAR